MTEKDLFEMNLNTLFWIYLVWQPEEDSEYLFYEGPESEPMAVDCSPLQAKNYIRITAQTNEGRVP